MSYFAELDQSGEVLRVIVADSIEWCRDNLNGSWIETKYDGSQRKNYAGIGFKYDNQRNAFIPPKPAINLTLDESTARWKFDTTEVDWIYVPVTTALADRLSEALFKLVYPDRSGSFCIIIPHSAQKDLSCLALRNADEIFVDPAVKLNEFRDALEPFLTQVQLAKILDSVHEKAGKVLLISDFIPTEWKPSIMDRATAIAQGYKL